MDILRALSVNNPWGWALCANLPDGKPFKSGENRTSRLGAPNVSKIVLIQVGLKKPNPSIVEEVERLADAFGIKMPKWAGEKRKEIGAVVGAVIFKADLAPSEVTDPYDQIWLTPPPVEGPDRRRFWAVHSSVLFPTPIPCKGSVRPLLFKVPPDVDAKARWMLASMRKGLVTP
jgi:hypothetical protein